jgi:4-amino-4-deoxy-L-arabinose transferase-like glycosyltransferase
LALAITAVHVVWVLRDHNAATWDDAHYLYLTWVYRRSLELHGPIEMVRSVYHVDPGRAPLLSVALIPFSYLFPTTGAGLLLNLILWPVLLLSAGQIAKELFNDQARLLAMVLIAPMPIVSNLSHIVLQDFLLLTLSTVAVLLVLRTRHLERWSASLGLGLIIALGTLTKISFVVAIVGPLVVTILVCVVRQFAARKREGFWNAFRRPMLNGALIAVLGIGLPLLWYVPNWEATRAYLHEAFRIQPGTVADPLTVDHLGKFALAIVNEALSWLLLALAGLVLLLSLPRLIARFRSRRDIGALLEKIAFLASWAILPIAAVAASTNQGARYAVAALPAIAVIVAGLISKISWPIVRRLLAGAAVLFAVNQALQINVTDYRVPLLPALTTFSTPFGTGYLYIGAVYLPIQQNYTLRVLDYLESRSRGAHGRIKPRTVALLQLNGYANGNDLPYYSLTRDDPFTFATLFNNMSKDELLAELKKYDFALYVPQPPATTVKNDRVTELNLDAAARKMTPAMFGLFKPHPKRFFIAAEGGQSQYVQVLERRGLRTARRSG